MDQENKEKKDVTGKKTGLWDVFTRSSSVDLDVVKELVGNGADVNCTDEFSETVLFDAVRSGFVEVTKYLVDQGADVNWKSDFGATPLSHAVQSHSLKIVKYLVERGADVSWKDTNDFPLLYWAVQSRSLDIVKYLVERGADVNWKYNNDQSLLYYAAQIGSSDIVKYLEERDAAKDLSVSPGLRYLNANRKSLKVRSGAQYDLSLDSIRKGQPLQLHEQSSGIQKKVRTSCRTGSVKRTQVISGCNIIPPRSTGISLQALIGPKGGVIQKDDVTLQLEAGCLTEDTEITVATKPHKNFVPKSLIDLGLVDAFLSAAEFLPHRLEFVKPAVLTIPFEKPDSDAQLFILHGSYNDIYEKIVWEVVTNGIDNDVDNEGVVNLKIAGFSWYDAILALPAKLVRVVSHYNHSFVCRPYALYRRQPSLRTIDIAVVLISEFVDDNDEKDIKQLKDHFDRGYHIGERGVFKRVHTDHHFQICLEFPGVKSSPISFKIDETQLDSDGYVIDNFRGITIEKLENGQIEIRDVIETTLLWRLTLIIENWQKTTENDNNAQSSTTEQLPEEDRPEHDSYEEQKLLKKTTLIGKSLRGNFQRVKEDKTDRENEEETCGTKKRVGLDLWDVFTDSTSLNLESLKDLVENGADVNSTNNFALIGPKGGVIQKDDVTLQLEAGCLTKDTEIIVATKPEKNFVPKSVIDLGLVDAFLSAAEFLPQRLKFLKPAVLTIPFERSDSDAQLFILHGSYNDIYEKIVWEVVTNGIDNDVDNEGVVNLKITGFSWYHAILALPAKLARVVAHYNRSIVCRAYALYRRQPSLRTIDIAVVLISEFVDDNDERDIKQLKDHFGRGYHIGEKGAWKRVHTDHHFQICLKFPGIESSPITFKIDKTQLDSDGYAIDDFEGITIENPANGRIEISDVIETSFLWGLTLSENWQKTTENDANAQSSTTEQLPEVVCHATKLTNKEISGISREVGLHWDGLGGLMDIPYYECEEIRFNCTKFSSKGEQVLLLFNESHSFDRRILKRCLDELGRKDLKDLLLPMENEDGTETTLSTKTKGILEKQLVTTPLSPREMYRLSRRVVDWNSLAGLLNIPAAERSNIRSCDRYYDDRSRAEKILSIFNRREEFSREQLARCLDEINQNDLIGPILNGNWRTLVIP